MCGISGIYKFNGGSVTDAELTRMRDTLAHRGPDGAANFVSREKHAGLSQRRLAIIDLSPDAACPMANDDRSIWITFNGEIYNFKKLREELKRRGHRFRTQGDTETILRGYEEYGPDIVRRLNGMFAFAIWDEKKKSIFAARDHVGIKPFYYAVQNGAFYFASEPKAILAHPDFKKELDEQNISYYLTFSCLPAPHTLFRDIRKLPAAHRLMLRPGGTLEIKEYWNPLESEKVSGTGSEEYFAEESLRLLKDSITGQMVSDVPFGCFLSGGIDSSTNAALMSRALGKPVETFSIGTAGNETYNEFEHSRKTAALLGAKTHERIVGPKDLFAFLPKYGFYADDPNGDPIAFLVYYLSELTRKNGVIVAQVGEGADELFAGYPQYLRAARMNRPWNIAANPPGPLRAAIFGAGRSALSSQTAEYLRRLARGESFFWGTAVAFSPLEKERLLASSFRKTLPQNHEYGVVNEIYRRANELDPEADTLKRIAYLELKLRLPEFLLARVDKMGMAHSIEARVPFLDYRLVELALQIPQNLKIKNGSSKYILKKAVRGVIPNEIIDRKKQGFGAPIAEWLRERETGARLLETIANSSLRERGILDQGYVERIAAEHALGAANHSFRLWNLITLSLWHDHWFR